MGGFAQIPQIESTVGVANVPNRPRPALLGTERAVQPLAAGVEALAKSTQQIAGIEEIQARHGAIIQADQAETAAKNQISDIYANARQNLPGDQWAPTVQEQGQKAIDTILADPANQSLAVQQRLQARLPAIHGMMWRDARDAGLVETGKVQDQQFKQMGMDAANESAGVSDADHRAAIRNGYETKIAAAYPNNPDKVNFYMGLYDKAEVQGRGQALAHGTDPGALDDFLKANPGAFNPQQKSALYSAQNEAMTMPLRQLDAQAGAARAASLQYQQQQIAQTGHPDPARLEHDAAFGVLRPEDYTRLTGMQYDRPTPAPIKGLYEGRIAQANTTDDLDEIKSDLHAAGANREMNGGDVQTYLGQVAEREKQIKRPEEAAKIDAEQALKRNYYPTTYSERFAHGPDFQRAHDNALAAFKSEMTKNPNENPWTAMDRAMKLWPRPTFGKPGATPTPATGAAPAPAGPPPTDAMKAAFKAWLATHPEAAR